MEKYLSKDERELLELVHHHRRQYEANRKRQGGLHPDDIEILKYLDKAEDFVKAIAKEREETEAEKFKLELTQCPECEVENIRKPLGEEKSEAGYMTNVFHCEACGIDYRDGKPNNGKQQMEWFQEFLDFFEKHKDEVEKIEDEYGKPFMELKDKGEKFKKAYEQELITGEKYRQALRKRDESVIQWRDYLLMAKIHGQWGSSPIGES